MKGHWWNWPTVVPCLDDKKSEMKRSRKGDGWRQSFFDDADKKHHFLFCLFLCLLVSLIWLNIFMHGHKIMYSYNIYCKRKLGYNVHSVITIVRLMWSSDYNDNLVTRNTLLKGIKYRTIILIFKSRGHIFSHAGYELVPC